MKNYNRKLTIRPLKQRGLKSGTLRAITAALLISGVFASAAQASQIGILRIQNESSATQTFTISHQYHSCVDFPAPGTVTTVGPNNFADIEYARTGGHGCDGDDGVFVIIPTFLNQSAQPQAVSMNGDAGLWPIWAVPNYPSRFENKGIEPISGNPWYIWHVKGPVPTKTTIGTPQGRWILACAGGQNCTNTLTSSVSKGSITDESWSSEIQNSLAVAITAGLEVETAGVTGKLETTVTTSTQSTTGEVLSLIQSNDSTGSDSCEQTIDFTKYDIHQVWQWSVSTKVGDSTISVKTCQITCTPDGVEPAYLPGSENYIGSCLHERGTPWVTKPSVKPPAPIAATVTEKAPFSDCVEFYTGLGGGDTVQLCGEQNSWKEYINLGRPGTNSHHYSVLSFKCGADVKYVQFINGNHNPWSRHNEQCQGGVLVTPNVWVKANATGVGLYK